MGCLKICYELKGLFGYGIAEFYGLEGKAVFEHHQFLGIAV